MLSMYTFINSLFCCKSLVYVFNIYFLLWKFFVIHNFPSNFLSLPMFLMVCSLSSKIYIIILLCFFLYIFVLFVCVCVWWGSFSTFLPSIFVFYSPTLFTQVLNIFPNSLCIMCCMYLCVFLCFLLCVFFYYLFYDCLKWPILSRLTTQIAHFLLLLLSIISV